MSVYTCASAFMCMHVRTFVCLLVCVRVCTRLFLCYVSCAGIIIQNISAHRLRGSVRESQLHGFNLCSVVCSLHKLHVIHEILPCKRDLDILSY